MNVFLPRYFAVWAGMVLVTVWPSSTRGQNLVSNGDFENTQNTFVADGNQLMSLPLGSTILPGWKVVNAEIVWAPNVNPFGPKTPSGSFFLDLTGYHDAEPYGGVEQTIDTVPGRSYIVSFSLGSNQDNRGYSGPMGVRVIAGTATNDFSMNVQTATGSVWQALSIPFTATASSTLIHIQGASAGGGQYIGLDNVALRSAGGVDALQNGSFENTSGTFQSSGDGGQTLAVGAGSIPGWTVTDAEIAWLANTNHYGGTTPFGSQFLDLTGYHDSAPYGGVSQTVPTVAGQRYQLLLSLGSYQDNPTYRGPVGATVTIGSQQTNITSTAPGVGNQWQTFSFEFVAASSRSQIQILGTKSTGGQLLGLDNIRVTPSVRISNVVVAQSQISFDIPAGNYAVETTLDLSAPVWQRINPTITGNSVGTATVWYPINRLEKQRFFRLLSL